MKTAVIAGYSGLVGSHLLHLLLADDHYDRVIGLGRKKIDLNHAKFTQFIVDFNALDFTAEKVDDVFCCLGTTMKKAGSKDKFRLVDFQYPLNLANVCLAKGANKFLMVSSMGASEHSGIFYNKVKGEVEKAVSQLGYKQVVFVRPSLLLGDRSESRLGEDISKVIMKSLEFMFFGPLKNYKAIKGSQVARALQYYAGNDEPGVRIYLSGQLLKI